MSNPAMIPAVITAIVLIAIVIAWLTYHLGHIDGWNDHADHERNREALRQIKANQEAGRAERRREAPEWYREQMARQNSRHQVPMGGLRSGKASYVTAAQLGPVAVPGPGRPQPGRVPTGPGTVTLPRARMSDTGEMAAATDEYIAGMRARAEADRQEILS